MLAQSKNRAKDVNRLHTWRALFIAAFVLLFLPSGATLLSIGMPKPAGFQQKPPNARSKKLPGPVDPKSVLSEPGVSTTQQRQPPQRPPPPPQPPHFQVIATPPSIRTGETVIFNIQPLGLVPKYPRQLEIDFGDKTPRLALDGAGTNIPHWYQTEGSHSVGIYLGSEKSAGSRPLSISDPLTVQVGPWSLGAVPHEIDIGGEVLFAIDNPPKDKAIEYWFHFDDDDSPDAKWTSDSAARHQYHSARVHRPYAEVRRVNDGSSTKPTETNRPQINVRPLADTSLQLGVAPQDTVHVGDEVKFTATLVSKFDKNDPHIRYRFDFGDKSPIKWQASSETTHHYSSPTTHYAQVEVAWVDEKLGVNTTIATSKPPSQIVVTEIPAPPVRNRWIGSSVIGIPGPSTPTGGRDWKPIIIPALAVITLAILFAGYQTYKKGRFSVKPDYQAHRDNGIAQTTGGSLAIEFDIRLKPDVTDAQYQLDVPEAGLIRYERRQHD